MDALDDRRSRRHRDRRYRRADGGADVLLAPRGTDPASRLPVARRGAPTHQPPRGLDLPDGRRRPARRNRAVERALGRLRQRSRDLRLAERLAAVHAAVLDHRAVDRNALLHAAQRARRRGTRRRGTSRHRSQHPHPGVLHRRGHRRPRRGRRPRQPDLHERIGAGPRRRSRPVVLPGLPRAPRRALRHPAHLLRLQRHSHPLLLHSAAVRARRRRGHRGRRVRRSVGPGRRRRPDPVVREHRAGGRGDGAAAPPPLRHRHGLLAVGTRTFRPRRDPRRRGRVGRPDPAGRPRRMDDEQRRGRDRRCRGAGPGRPRRVHRHPGPVPYSRTRPGARARPAVPPQR